MAEFVKDQTAGDHGADGVVLDLRGHSARAPAAVPSATKSRSFSTIGCASCSLKPTSICEEAKVIDVDKPAPGALDDSIARKVASEAKVSLPLGTIKAQDVSKAPK